MTKKKVCSHCRKEKDHKAFAKWGSIHWQEGPGEDIEPDVCRKCKNEIEREIRRSVSIAVIR